MNRVTHGVRGDGEQAHSPLPRRSPRGQSTSGRGAQRGDTAATSGPRRTGGRYSRAARASAEPLRASWRPKSGARDSGDEPGLDQSPGRRAHRARAKLAKLTATYGWRIYALPVLAAVTVLVIVDAASGPANGSGDQASGAGAGSDPAATEHAAGSLDIPTAELPAGGAFTQAGSGDWRVLPGSGERVGSASKTYTYTIEVENGIDPASYAGDDGFAKAVEGTLSDPRSWTGAGEVSLQRVDGSEQEPDFRVSLTTPETNHKSGLCGYQIAYESSCYSSSNNDRVVINLARWVRGALTFRADLGTYRQYAINHEVGHALGQDHVGCPQDGGLAPVMMQQTFGVANDYVAQLNEADPGNYGAVPADGKVCKYNAWPNPQPASAR